MENFRDETIIKEAVKRLMGCVFRKTKTPMKYGSFTIQVHDGNFSYIEFNLKDRCFKHECFNSKNMNQLESKNEKR